MAKNSPLKTHDDDYPPPAKVEGSELLDPNAPKPKAAAPEPEMTIADEQRKRSEEIEAMGVEAWKKKHFPVAAALAQVAGVVEHHK